MKLFCHPVSPFARKAMILARLHGIDLEELKPEKDGANGYKAGDNPLGKFPPSNGSQDSFSLIAPLSVNI